MLYLSNNNPTIDPMSNRSIEFQNTRQVGNATTIREDR